MRTLTEIEVQTKKNTTMTTTWDVEQMIPHPQLRIVCGKLDWENGDGLFGRYGRNMDEGLPKYYYAVLLRSDYDEAKREGSSKDHAGYDGSPGSIMYRGTTLGEVTVRFSIGHEGRTILRELWVRGYAKPTPSERTFLMEQVIPRLADFVQKNNKALLKQAVQRLEKDMAEKVAEAVASVAKVKAKAKKALEIAKGGEL